MMRLMMTVLSTALLVVGAALAPIGEDVERAETPLVAGKVVDKSGKPYESSLPVELRLWPGEDVLSKLKVGDGVKVATVAKGETDSLGMFSLSLESSDSVARMVGDSEFVDLEVVVETPDGLAPFSFSLTRDEFSGADEANATTNEERHGDLLDLTLEPIVKGTGAVGKGSSQGVPEGALDDPLTDGSASYTNKLYCEWVQVKNLGNKRVNVGSAYISTSGVSHDFQFSAGAAMTIGVGYSASGDDIGFSQTGTSTRTTSADQDYATISGTNNHRIYQTYYRYAVFRERCQTSATSGWYWANNWEARPAAWAAGTPTNPVNQAPATTKAYCTKYPTAPSSFTKSATAAITWSTGVSLSADIGVNFSSQSGWTSKVKSAWKLSTANRWLCGTNDSIGGNARRLVARTF